ncbi:MAG: glycosyltransferase family A protein, partial [Desulfomonilia bacterium]|nr:glycosyltransferase family A protein [Desulfomonilia bacterium]
MDKNPLPNITFGIIVLNGEPFTRYCLRQIYPHAHQIIVVEGAAPAARNISTSDGHSTDGTLQVLRDFQQYEDPDRKITIITAEDEGHPDGFWPGEKDEQSRANA